MTPDRVSFGGREQAPLQWAVKVRNASSRRDAWRSIPSSSTSASALTPVPSTAEPYHLQAVGHSLGGAALIIYAVMCKVLGRQHHLSRLVLLTPGGFHRKYPNVALPFIYILPVIMKMLNFWRPGVVSMRKISKKTFCLLFLLCTFVLHCNPNHNNNFPSQLFFFLVYRVFLPIFLPPYFVTLPSNSQSICNTSLRSMNSREQVFAFYSMETPLNGIEHCKCLIML
jgi:hypothetical protein